MSTTISSPTFSSRQSEGPKSRRNSQSDSIVESELNAYTIAMREYTVKNWGHILTNYNLTAEPHNLDAGQKSDLELDQSPFEGVAL